MKYVLTPKLMEIANKASRVPGLKAILRPFYYKYKEKAMSQRNTIFREHALGVLTEFDKACNDAGVYYSLAFGSMLGAVREKGFIKHDLDIDVFMWAKDYSPQIRQIIEQKSFYLDHYFLVEDGMLGREETYKKDGVSIDIFYLYYDHEGKVYTCDFFPLGGTTTVQQSQREKGGVLARRHEIPVSYNRIKVPFESIELFIPENYDEYLRLRYGVDYMTPNPNWVNGEHPCVKEWNSVHACYYKNR